MMFTSETDCLMNMFWVLKICLIIGEFTIISCSIKHIYKYISKGWPLGGGKGMVTDIYNIQYASFTMFGFGAAFHLLSRLFSNKLLAQGPNVNRNLRCSGRFQSNLGVHLLGKGRDWHVF